MPREKGKPLTVNWFFGDFPYRRDARCVHEIESARGMKLRITMKNVAASELAPLIRECAR